MSMIWLISVEDEWSNDFSEVLNGFFAVKRVASLKNFVRMLKIHDSIGHEPVSFLIRTSTSDDLMSHHSAISAYVKRIDPNRVFYMGEMSGDLRQLLATNALQVVETTHDLIEVCKVIRDRISKLRSSATIKPPRDTFQIADIEIDRMAATMRILNTDVVELLTPKEVKILQVLSVAPDYSVSREELMKRVWTGAHVSASTIDSHMSRLRKKVDHSFECSIETQYGSGWSLTMRSAAKF